MLPEFALPWAASFGAMAVHRLNPVASTIRSAGQMDEAVMNDPVDEGNAF